MKTIKILTILFIILGIIYYEVDKRLFYYGKNELHIYQLLPLKIEPEYGPLFEGGFALRDGNGFTIAANGNSYPINNKKIIISQILKYGFNENHLVAVIRDVNKNKYDVEFTQNPKDNSVIDAAMNVDKSYDINLYKWIDVDGNENYIWNLVLYRNCLMFIVIISFILLMYKLVKYKKMGIQKNSN